MKMVKSLLLGSAAGLIAVAGAQAADLPVKAKAVEYVKICSLYGVGYYYIPGTATCFTLGRSDTFFAFYNGAAYGLVPFGFDGSSGPSGLNVAAYTWQFGNGLSA